MNHFKLRKYPLIYLDDMQPTDISKIIDDYVG